MRREPSLLLLLPSLLLLIPAISAKPAITDAEVLAKKQACLEDINSGLWGMACKASIVAKQNCILQCVSSDCYEHIYGSDPLEEGEIDAKRGREFKHCVRRESRGEDVSSMAFFVDD